ncbi:uncharacterized protein LOC102804411, partial [Saccoglossus kowalevskii]|uniref:Uncharacterized protein LOC102804411 n=1 Tax=Saccoglossus kowalevskii TaxID=10224 RepID=A0ABM0N1H9_SACKO
EEIPSSSDTSSDEKQQGFYGVGTDTSKSSHRIDVGKDRPGGDMNDGNSNLVDSAEECYCACIQTNGCQAWSFRTDSNGCWLKNSVPDQTTLDTAISGVISGGEIPSSSDTSSDETQHGFYGIGTGNNLWSRKDISASWEGPIADSCCITSMTTFPDGTIVGIGTDQQLWTRPGKDGKWSGPIANSCCVTDITYLNDGSLLGIGTGNNLWTRPGIDGKWSGPVANSCCVKSISQLPSGDILGVGMNGKLWTRPGVEGSWTKVDNSGNVSGITVTSEGNVIGIGSTCGMWERKEFDSGCWGNEIANSRCVKSVSVVRTAYSTVRAEK